MLAWMFARLVTCPLHITVAPPLLTEAGGGGTPPSHHVVVTEVVEAGAGGELPLRVLLGQVDAQLLEGLHDVIPVVAAWAFKVFGATGHS